MRYREHLQQRYAAMLTSVGSIIALAGLVMLTPILVLPFYPGETRHALAFLAPALFLLVTGLILKKSYSASSTSDLTISEGGVIVLISWITVTLVSAVPFRLVSGLPFSYGVFEAVSGWTTTGLSLVDVNTAGPMILLWRSTLQFFGGAGLAILVLSSVVGNTGIGISSAEGRGDQLEPNVRRSARLVMIIYCSYAVTGIAAYVLAGMSVFDAVNHSFAAISTGGFSTRQASIGFWNSPAIEGITVVLMLLGNLSFVTAWFLWRGNTRTALGSGEVRLQTLLVLSAATGLFFLTCGGFFVLSGQEIRSALFEAVSASTTTGFSISSYSNWNPFGIFTIIILMLIGGGTCSTAGGIKQFRVYLLLKTLFWEMKCFLLPKSVVHDLSVKEGGGVVFPDESKVRQAATFTFMYMVVFLLGSLALTAYDYPLQDSLFEFGSALGTVGLSVGVVSQGMPTPVVWILTVAMFLGRLEFLVVFVSMAKIARDLRAMKGRR